MVIGPGELEAVLASAEFALANAAIGPADAIAGGTRTRRNLEHIRFHCRQLRTALVELAGSDLADNIDKVDKARCICRELRTAFLELNPAATIPFRCLEPSCSLIRLPRTTCWVNHLEGVIATQRLAQVSCETSPGAFDLESEQPIDAAKTGFPARERGSGDSRPLRQTVGLLALILAYLAYFHVDVQLQIVSLPAIFP